MRNYEEEIRQRTAFIRRMLEEAHGEGIVFGNSGGKDCALVGALCRMACENVTGVIMPCQSRRNYQEDAQDALASAEKFGFRTLRVDVTSAKEALAGEIEKCCGISHMAGINMNPRLRMIVLYHRSVRKLPGCRHRKPERALHGIFHQMGRRRLRLQSHWGFDSHRGI